MPLNIHPNGCCICETFALLLRKHHIYSLLTIASCVFVCATSFKLFVYFDAADAAPAVAAPTSPSSRDVLNLNNFFLVQFVASSSFHKISFIALV